MKGLRIMGMVLFGLSIISTDAYAEISPSLATPVNVVNDARNPIPIRQPVDVNVVNDSPIAVQSDISFPESMDVYVIGEPPEARNVNIVNTPLDVNVVSEPSPKDVNVINTEAMPVILENEQITVTQVDPKEYFSASVQLEENTRIDLIFVPEEKMALITDAIVQGGPIYMTGLAHPVTSVNFTTGLVYRSGRITVFTDEGRGGITVAGYFIPK